MPKANVDRDAVACGRQMGGHGLAHHARAKKGDGAARDGGVGLEVEGRGGCAHPTRFAAKGGDRTPTHASCRLRPEAQAPTAPAGR